MTVFTIGYERLSPAAFLSLLAAHGIETVVDIREVALSRKPGFSKTALANLLSVSGFEYVHMMELGCPKPVRDRYREDGDWKRYTKGFMKHMKTQDLAIAQLSNLVMQSSCALLCYEADPNVCHRSIVAHAVRDHCGAQVQHIKAVDATIARPALHPPSFALAGR
jgi:uncharacterized protein (DUF488 family)